MSLDSIISRTVKLRFGRPLGRPASKLDIQDTGGKDSNSSLARSGGSECTVCTTSGLCCFGISETTFAIDNAGEASKPTIVGFIPRDFYAFDGVMSKDNGGFGVDAKGGLVGFDNVGKGGNLAFATGDRVTLKLDFLEGLASIAIETSAGKKKTNEPVVVSFDPRIMRGMCYPACSLASSGAAVSIEKVVDVTSVDGFVKRLAGGSSVKGGKSGGSDQGYTPDAFGTFWMRLYCRMKDSDSLKIPGSSAPFKKDDVMAQMLLCGVDSYHHGMAAAVAAVGECPAVERQREIFFAATTDMFKDGSRSASTLVEALGKMPSPIVSGQGGHYSPFAFFATALVNYMDSERNSSINQLQHALLSLKTRVDSLDGGKGDSSGSFLPDINKKPNSVSNGAAGSKAPAPKPAAKGFVGAAATNNATATTTTPATPAGKDTAKQPAAKPAAKPAPKAPPPKTAGGPAPKTSSGAPSGNSIMQTVRQLRKRAEEIHTLSQKGSPTDDDLKKLEEAKSKMSKEKLAAAKTVQALAGNAAALKSLDDDLKMEIQEFFEDMVGEGDHIEGNAAFAQALIEKIPIEWAEFVSSKHLDSVAAYDGSLEYLELFLALDGLETDAVDLLQNAMFNQSRRIPAVMTVMKYEHQLKLDEILDEVLDTWQEFFEDICSQAKSIPREDRTGRMELITLMLHHPLLTVDPMKEGADGQTAFSRAAKEGDIPLMKLLLKDSKIDVNKVSTDTTTALIQAVVANEVEAVKLILAQPKINVGHVSQEGSALFLARALHRDAAIVKALESAK